MRSKPRNRVGLIAALLSAVLSGCGTNPVAKIDSHLRNTAQATQSAVSPVPAPVTQVPIPPPPKPVADEKRYSVSVIDVPAREILLAMSRDTGVNIDIYPGIEGRVTLNAIDQTIRQILTRMAKQIDMRWEADGPNLSVMPDTPYLKLYRVDYVNITRDMDGTFGVQTQVVGPATSGGSSGGGQSGGSGGGQNSSQVKVTNTSKNRFWENLEKNIKDLLRETDKQLPEGSSETVVRAQTQGFSTATTRTQPTSARASARGQAATITPGETQAQNEQVVQTLTFREAASVIINPETGTISVRATSRQHEKIGQFIELVAGAAKRQVLIEATVVEVELNDGYQSGVDWSSTALQGLGYSFQQVLTRSSPTPTGTDLANNFFSVGYANPNAAVGGSIKSTITLLSSFGTTKVLSSPRTTTLNNQTAVMKVVENRVYFTIATTPAVRNEQTGAVTSPATYTTTPNVVPVGFVMSVTPQIGENDIVTLNIRPSITAISSFAQDPNPDLRVAVPNLIPQLQTREFETVLRVASGQTTVLGGLMQDSFKATRDGLPILSRIPVFGDAVSYRNDAGKKSELVVFIRPIVIKDASVDSDLSEYKRYLPDGRFFKEAEPVVDVRIPGVPDPVQPRP
jgi:general secretion pathway protein D